ncbi:hypothetical protein SDC9_74667 [bioreactor metagenome]|uniref:Uncharacterized protein n=1 Tax=bioreactor metagenome TaxID=1076179 RepID=A0A644YJF9_9ZZZZ
MQKNLLQRRLGDVHVKERTPGELSQQQVAVAAVKKAHVNPVFLQVGYTGEGKAGQSLRALRMQGHPFDRRLPQVGDIPSAYDPPLFDDRNPVADTLHLA